MRVAKVFLVLASAILLHYAESSSPPRNDIPAPAENILPERFIYYGGTIHDIDRPNAHPYIVDRYFLGMDDGQYLHPLFNDNPYRVYSFRQHALVVLTREERNLLLNGHSIGWAGRQQQQQQQHHYQPHQQASTSNPSFYGPSAFSGLPGPYFFADGQLHEHGRPQCRPFIKQNYFLGMIDHMNNIYPVDPTNIFNVYSLVARSMVLINHDIRMQLLNE